MEEAAGAGMQERRQYPRVKAWLMASATFPTGKTLQILTRNIGGGGACFELEEQCAVGTQLQFEVKLPDFNKPIACTAEVVWVKPVAGETTVGQEKPRFETGVRFLAIDPKERSTVILYAKMNAIPSQPESSS